ncbi:5-formyltetrahydrofolate cyclo-ligase [Paenibacillus tarimensis]|uniref:5-formyltetrahydrofolate cyclo-ligase n=1 Tax=Paenibacillus tarimensis TaxID=416012 RepID=UPI001F1EDB5A|nr:5-formyltetrahydrofolate cyclo-ligase [Paenibacillus tarimensis]MCF2943491.1 5-formyltetrahydrofolate cyclo-ligase [Paenibacillus tarimensis]
MATRNEAKTKQELRQAMAAKRDSLAPAVRQRRSEEACARAADWLSAARAGSVMLYIGFRSELDTRPLITSCWARGIEVIVPRSIPADRSMELFRLRSWEELAAGAYGILEPDPAIAAPWAEGRLPDIVITPGLAFDRSGGRLGYGGGYYDRLRARLDESEYSGTTLWVGLCYDIQLVSEVPMEDHDARLHGLITETGFYAAV